MSTLTALSLSLMAGMTVLATRVQALTFNFIYDPTLDPNALAGFQAAGQIWSSYLLDDVTVNLEIGFSDLGTDVLAQASSIESLYSYTAFRQALFDDITSDQDAIAVSSLANGPSIDLLINGTADNPAGPGSLLPYVDNDGGTNNSLISLTNANAKALGLLDANGTAIDASITFSSAFNWDFDRSDGITLDVFDFVGIAVHEIGHALGFLSGVEALDTNLSNPNGPFSDDAFQFVTPLDLFRYSTQSTTAGVVDWTADNRDKYFSLDQGVTSLGGFSTGSDFGDGQQSSHWKDSLGLGIMDPTIAPGELAEVTDLDLLAFDVIGWDEAEPPKSVPEGMPLLGLWGVGMLFLQQKARQFLP
ncbi:hypothetical protein BST81_21030 [Leptolyngbya sp. 'hensonii']|nr:hypothetical protein BST81_21030 [Leptolyngbya sp. 'hensonii']